MLSDVSERDAQYQLSKAQALLQNPELGEEVPIIKHEDLDASSSDYSHPEDDPPIEIKIETKFADTEVQFTSPEDAIIAI